jgi:hypothetical protein
MENTPKNPQNDKAMMAKQVYELGVAFMNAVDQAETMGLHVTIQIGRLRSISVTEHIRYSPPKQLGFIA